MKMITHIVFQLGTALLHVAKSLNFYALVWFQKLALNFLCGVGEEEVQKACQDLDHVLATSPDVHVHFEEPAFRGHKV